MFYLILFFLSSLFSQNIEDRVKLVDNNDWFEFNLNNILIHKKMWTMDFQSELSPPVICDANGNYLFTIASNQVWNNIELNEFLRIDYNVMKNGYLHNDYIISRGLNHILVLPQPQSTCEYFIFQVDAGVTYQFDSIINGYEYQVIDMKGDNGKGEVIEKNIMLNDSSCSALAGIPSKDKKSYWIISIDYPSIDLNVHQLTKDGVRKINANTYADSELYELYQRPDFVRNNPRDYGLPFVEMKVNQHNNLIAIVGSDRSDGRKYFVRMYDFDNETGKISFKYQLKNKNQYTGFFWLCFTPDSKYLYFGRSIYDLSLESQEEIQNSEFEHDNNFAAITTDPFNNVVSISFPDIFKLEFDGSELKKELLATGLINSGSIGEHNGFSIFPSIYLNNLEKVITIIKEGRTKYCSGETVFITTEYEPEFEEVTHRWYDKDSNIVGEKDLIIENVKKEHVGWYYYEISAECGVNKKRDSVYIEVQELEPIITTTKTTFCEGDSTTLSLDTLYSEILWNTGETTQDIVVKNEGVYSATVTEGNCTNDTSIVINVNPLPEIEIEVPDGTILCDGGSIEIEAKVPPGTQIQWENNSRLPKRTINQSGTYTITATNIATGCKSEKSIEVTDIDDIEADIVGNTSFCDGESTTLTIQPQGNSYRWNTGETTQSIEITESGLYSATITTEAGCEIWAEKEVEKMPLPEFEILGEKIICNNEVEIYPDKDFEKYEWSTGETSKTINIDQIGIYTLTVTDENGCQSLREIEITEADPSLILSKNEIDFGEIIFGNNLTETITADKEIIIIRNTTLFNADVNNNEINITFNPDNIGAYEDYIIVESIGDCKASDTIKIKGICKAEILASVTNSEGYPGDNVSNQVSLELLQEIPLPIEFNYEITLSTNQDAIRITDATTFDYANGKLLIDLEDFIKKEKHKTDFDPINSKIMLANNLDNPLEITHFTTDNDYLIPLRQNGNIKIYEICLYEERLIEFYNPAQIQKISKTEMKLSTYYAGKYEIEIADISGKTISKQSRTTDKTQEIEFNYNLSNGTYIIKITEPGKTQTRKIAFVE